MTKTNMGGKDSFDLNIKLQSKTKRTYCRQISRGSSKNNGGRLLTDLLSFLYSVNFLILARTSSPEVLPSTVCCPTCKSLIKKKECLIEMSTDESNGGNSSSSSPFPSMCLYFVTNYQRGKKLTSIQHVHMFM